MTSEAPELLPCPFCGCQKASVLPCNSDWIRKHRIYPIVRCGGCYLDLPGKNDDFSEDGKTAVAAWNTRSTNQQALDAAREEGRRVGLEQAANWVENAAVTETWEWPEYIRAMIDKPADPVVEAARVLADHVRERHWKYYLIEMPLTKDGQGPATFGEDAVSVSYEVWEAETFRTVSSHVYLPDAIEAWLYTLAQKEGE